MLRITGKKIRAWNIPKRETRKKILKNVVKTCEVEKAVRMKARNVLKPPLRTAGPMSRSVLTALSSPEPSWPRKL